MSDREEPAGTRHPRTDHTSPALVAIFSLLTMGLYLPIWYLRRMDRLNSLDAPSKLRPAPVLVLLGMYAVSASGLLAFVGANDVQSALMLNSLGHALTIAGGMILISLRLRTRHILREHFAGRPSPAPRFSGAATVLLGEIYLQAKMNRFLNDPLGCPAPSQGSIAVACEPS